MYVLLRTEIYFTCRSSDHWQIYTSNLRRPLARKDGAAISVHTANTCKSFQQKTI